MSCEKFVHTEESDMDWVCICGHDTDWHGMSPSNPGGPCAACAESPVITPCPDHNGPCPGPYTEQETIR